MKVELTKRDFAVLKTIDDFGFLTTNQIRKLFFKGLHRSVIYRRLKLLHENRFLRFSAGSEKGLYVWRLSQKALKAIGSDNFIKAINHNTLRHDCISNDVRIILQELGICKNWIASHGLIRKAKDESLIDSNNIPDWLCSYLKYETSVPTAIEVELNMKSKKRLESTIMNYYNKKVVKFVWYFVPTKKMGESINQAFHDFAPLNTSKISHGYTILDELKNEKEKTLVYFKDSSASIEKLSELKKRGKKVA